MTVVAYVPDLMDQSRVRAAAGDKVAFVPSPAALPEAAGDSAAEMVVVDLSRPGVLDVLAALASHGVRTIGFASHVDRTLLAAATQAGCTEVMPRSAFFRRLPELLGDPGAPR
jgi:hypothetical protein